LSQVQLIQPPSHPGAGPLLSIRDLCVTFEKPTLFFGQKRNVGVKAVDHVSFDLNESDCVSLVGESGSGKTTVARSILRLVDQFSGSISFNGTDIQKLKGGRLRDYRRDVQIIYQDPYGSLDPRQDVFTTVSYPLIHLKGERNRDHIAETVRDLLEEVGMDSANVEHRLPHQLSGGQRQRVNIARALASNPSLLIADEPITMLDAPQRLNILSLLNELKAKRKLTLLLITHDLASAKILSEKVMVMYLGRIVEYGPTKEVLSGPRHPYVQLIMDALPKLVEGFDLFKDYTATAGDEAPRVTQGCNFRPRCSYATKVCETTEPELLEKSKLRFAACHNPLVS
jgi:peptide/nickel transport system ATP-binding protein